MAARKKRDVTVILAVDTLEASFYSQFLRDATVVFARPEHIRTQLELEPTDRVVAAYFTPGARRSASMWAARAYLKGAWGVEPVIIPDDTLEVAPKVTPEDEGGEE